MSDAELVRQARAGRTDAFAQLAQRWVGRVTAVCHARLRHAHVADDVAQETLLRGFRALHTLTDPDRFGAWLCGIALRICLDWRKAKQNGQVPFSVLDPEQDPDEYLAGRTDADLVERADERRHLLAEVEALPEECRQVVMLYYYDDTTYRDIARLIGVSPATVNARLTKARALLRERLVQSR